MRIRFIADLGFSWGLEELKFILAGILLALASTAAWAQRDMDCSDFRNWREAQDFYERSGPGDPHRLDADNDGIACESLR